MANIFSRTNDAVAKVPRNTFDGSFQNNLTLQLGGLYPVFCKEVLPGDSFKIDITFGLRFMPLTFPIQTRMQANLHFFYVRNRNLWKDWANFISNVSGSLTDSSKTAPIPPYLNLNESSYNQMIGTGKLSDYLGLPTTINGDYGGEIKLRDFIGYRCLPLFSTYETTLKTIQSAYSAVSQYKGMTPNELGVIAHRDDPEQLGCFNTWYIQTRVPLLRKGKRDEFFVEFGFDSSYWKDAGLTYTQVLNSMVCGSLNSSGQLDGFFSFLGSVTYEQTGGNSVKVKFLSDKLSTLDSEFYGICVFQPKNMFMYGKPDVFTDRSSDSFSPTVRPEELAYASRTSGILDPDWSSSVYSSKEMRISAFPFRAYESIYNAFYRDIRNNPYILNGTPEYNQYIPSVDGGADNNVYTLRYRNWEPDFLTTAVQSPQQGIAPLVGVSSTGVMKFADDGGKVYTAQAQFAEDGETITSFSVNSPDMPVGNLRALVDIASSGISINDFRNVNALQRYLETNMRKGLRYKDWIKGHFDVDTSYAELDMPEFIGGVSKPVMVNQVTATASTDIDTLGDYAGQASCMGQSNTISRYFDEHGFVIGIISVSPVPNYSQLMPKMFLKENALDYYTPEFGHIGYQPITYKEVCPLQTFQSNDKLSDVFGYQRAWYDYIANVDEVHGEFRTTLQDFLINRYFNSRPELSEQFLLIDPETVNKPFKYQDKVNQPILGQLWFDVRMKRPIPQLGIPRLE